MNQTVANTKKKCGVLVFKTKLGQFYRGDSSKVLRAQPALRMRKKINLILTSPPFPLNRRKNYGNLKGEEFADWLASFAELFSEYITDDGSIVIEMGNSWNKGQPTNSTLPMETLLRFKDAAGLHLCQEFVHYNPARLPSPVEWVNKRRVRVKDSFTRIWWLSKTPNPYADNRQVLQEYSSQMKNLLRQKAYNSGRRPSQHKIGEKSFLNDNGGAIPSNVLIASNTASNDKYTNYCKEKGIKPHPARMPTEIVEFFVKFLTKRKDRVMDPFAGSNTTGAVCESLGRKWVSIEREEDFIKGSKGRFLNE